MIRIKMTCVRRSPTLNHGTHGVHGEGPKESRVILGVFPGYLLCDGWLNLGSKFIASPCSVPSASSAVRASYQGT